MGLFVGLMCTVVGMKHHVLRMPLFYIRLHTHNKNSSSPTCSVQLLDKGHFVYLHNFYNSYELNLELLG